MKKIVILTLILFCSCSPRVVRLQWNQSWRSDVPYELTFDPLKLGGGQIGSHKLMGVGLKQNISLMGLIID